MCHFSVRASVRFDPRSDAPRLSLHSCGVQTPQRLLTMSLNFVTILMRFKSPPWHPVVMDLSDISKGPRHPSDTWFVNQSTASGSSLQHPTLRVRCRPLEDCASFSLANSVVWLEVSPFKLRAPSFARRVLLGGLERLQPGAKSGREMPTDLRQGIGLNECDDGQEKRRTGFGVAR